TRYYSPKRREFIFNDTNEKQRHDFLAAKTYWLSGVLGGNQPVWLTDPRDAQYLDSTVEDLKKIAAKLATEGLITLPEPDYAVPTEALMQRRDHYAEELAQALAFTKPSFNEDMRGGHTNM